MNKPNCKISIVSPSERKQEIIAYLNSQLPPQHQLTEAQWDWEFSHHPDLAFIDLVEVDGFIAGLTTIKPIHLIFQGKEILSGRGEYTYFLINGIKQFRAFHHIGIETCIGLKYQLLWSITSLKTRQVFCNKANWNYLQLGIQEYSIVLRPQLDKTNLYLFLKSIYKMFRNIQRKNEFIRKLSKNNKDDFSYDYSEDKFPEPKVLKTFQKALSTQSATSLLICLDSEILNWRVISNPNLDYIVRFFYKQNSLLGYYICSVKNEIAHLNTIMFLDGGTLTQMLADLVKQLKSTGCKSVGYIGNSSNFINHQIFSVLSNNKIKRIKNTHIEFIYKNLVEGSDIIEDKNWLINGLWFRGYDF